MIIVSCRIKAHPMNLGKPAFSTAVRRVRQTSSANPGLGTALDHWLSPAASTMRPQSKTSITAH
jgi:hypothetical protein